MPRPPEQERSHEQEPQVYYLASRFQTKQEAAVPYYAVQETIRKNECDLSAYRFKRQWEESNDRPWYVVVIGEKPPEAVHQRLTTALAQGEKSSVPQQALDTLLIRRITEASKGEWVEGHYGDKGMGLGIRYTDIKFSRRSRGKGHRRK